MPRAERILISAFVGSDNLGDEAVFLALARQLAARLGGRRLTVASIDTARTRALLDGAGDPELADIEVTSRARLPVAIARHDLCVFGGGGIVQDQSSLLNLLYFLGQIQLARLFGRRVALAFVGIGPLRSRIGRAWARVALSGIACCVVRDPASKRLLEDLGVKGTAVLSASDIAVDLECRDVRARVLAIDGPYLLLSLRHLSLPASFLTPASRKSGPVRAGSPLARMLDGIARELATVLETHERLAVVAVPFFRNRDELVHRALRARLSDDHRRRFLLVDALSDPCDYAALARRAACVVAMRLHALVLALPAGVPLVALAYSPKVAAFMQQLGLDDYVLDPERETGLERLAGLVDDAIATRDERATRTGERAALLSDANREALEALCRVIDGTDGDR